MRRKALLIFGLMAIVSFAHQQVSAMLVNGGEDDGATTPNARFSETDTYLDLNTGKSFKFIYDGLNDIYNRDDLFGLDLFVNTRTKDTLWLDDAIVVNNALLRDAAGKYKIDPMKVKRDGNTYKVKVSAQN